MVLRRNRLPAPLHMAGALLRYSHLTLAQRLSAARAALALGRLDLGNASGTLGEWLAAHGQDPATVAALWDLIALPTLNLPAAGGSLRLGAFVLQTGLLRHNDAGDIGFHMRPLSETLGDPAARVLSQAGVDVRFGVRVEAVERVERGEGVGADAAEVEHVVPELDAPARVGGIALFAAAHPHCACAPAARSWRPTRSCVRCPTSARVPCSSRCSAKMRTAGAGWAPRRSLTCTSSYDRRVCDLRFAAGVGTTVQYVFDRSEAAGLDDGQYLAISLSGAAGQMELSFERLRERYVGAMEELFPRARGAVVRSVHVSREHAATFAARPGTESLRPGPRTSVAGLVIAGAWTDTGWPATLEGAVLSGHAAAQEVLT